MKRPNSAEIVVYRIKSKLLSRKTFKLYVDDRKVSVVYNDSIRHFFASPGPHSIYIKFGRRKSETLFFDLNINQTIHLECGFKSPEPENIKSLRDIKETINSLKDALYLIQIDSVPYSTQIDDVLFKQTKKRIYAVCLNALSRICLVMCIVGFLGFTNGFITAWGKAFWVTPNTELPLGAPESIAVDRDGNVYLAANFYYRIQKYSPDGEFLRGWPSNDNDPRIRINEDNQFELANNRKTRKGDYPDTLATYDLEGNLISEEVIDGCYFEFGEECERLCRDKNGNLYSIHNKWWRPHIIKTSYLGVKTKIVQTPWYLWLFLGPFPAWIFFAVGLIGFGKLNR